MEKERKRDEDEGENFEISARPSFSDGEYRIIGGRGLVGGGREWDSSVFALLFHSRDGRMPIVKVDRGSRYLHDFAVRSVHVLEISRKVVISMIIRR